MGTLYKCLAEVLLMCSHNRGPPRGSGEQGNNVIYFRETEHTSKNEGNRRTKVISGYREHRKLRL